MLFISLLVILMGGSEVSLEAFPDIKSVVWQKQKNAIVVYVKEGHESPDDMRLIGCYLQAAKREPQIAFPFNLSFYQQERRGAYLLPKKTFEEVIKKGDCESKEMQEKMKEKVFR